MLLGHGIGHSMGLLGLLKVAALNPAWNGDSWLLSGATGTTLTQAVGVDVAVLFAVLGLHWSPNDLAA